jgi:Zn-dependent protease
MPENVSLLYFVLSVLAELPTVQKIAVFTIPVIFAITLHEVAHGWVANHLGDNTAKQEGRLTLNPLSHIDPIGTVLVPGIMFFTVGFMFGWAKPVPVNPSRLHQPRRDMALVAIAGPGANLLMMVFWTLAVRLGYETQLEFIVLMGYTGMIINLILMVLNLLPILPLDGGRIVNSLLPLKYARMYAKTEIIGLVLVLVLLFSGILNTVFDPVLKYSFEFVHHLIV